MLEKIKKHKTLLKCLVASLLLWYVFQSVDISVLFSLLAEANLYMLGAAFFLAVTGQLLISNYKWFLILKAYRSVIPFKTLCDLYLMSMFFSMFLPGSYGGDLIRAYKVSAYTGNRVEGVMSVILERTTGLMALLVIMFISLIIIDQSLVSFSLKVWGITLLSMGTMISVLVFSTGRIGKVFFFFVPNGGKIEKKAIEVYESLHILKNKKVAAQVISLSIIFQFMVVLVNYMIALSLNINIPFSYLMFAIPVISLISMAPITFSGIGVRDLSYIGMFGAIGIDRESAFSVGFITFIILLIVSLYGGVIYLKQKELT